MKTAEIIETNLKFSGLSERLTTDMIVIHHTGSVKDMDASAEQIHGWHLGQGWAGIGYHFVIRKDGTIERGRPEWAIGSHAYGNNNHTIGIHLSGDFNAAHPAEAQIDSCALLVANLCEKYGIATGRKQVLGHGELDASVTPKGCPGLNLAARLDEIVERAKAYWAGTNEDEGSGETVKRYNTVAELPEWAKSTIMKMINKGFLNGSGKEDENYLPIGLDLSMDMIRVFVVNDRAGLYD